MNADEVRARQALSRSDAWLLMALTEGSHDGRPVRLADFVHDADWLNRAIPTFDEVSFGFPRLVAHGLLRVDGLTVQATPRAIALRKSITSATLGGGLVEAAAERVGARPYPEVEEEDRSLGRLAGLEPAHLEAAAHAHAASMEGMARRLRRLMRAADLVARPLMAARRAFRRVRRS